MLNRSTVFSARFLTGCFLNNNKRRQLKLRKTNKTQTNQREEPRPLSFLNMLLMQFQNGGSFFETTHDPSVKRKEKKGQKHRPRIDVW